MNNDMTNPKTMTKENKYGLKLAGCAGVTSVLVLVLFLFSFIVPLPYYIEVPGGAEDIRQVLTVDGKEDQAAGSYNFVTVGIQHATFSHLVYAWLTPFTDIYSAQDMTGAQAMRNICGLINFLWKLRRIWQNIRD